MGSLILLPHASPLGRQVPGEFRGHFCPSSISLLACPAPPPLYHQVPIPHPCYRLTGDCEGVRGAMPQLSWVLGELGGLGTGDRSGLEPTERGHS